MESKESKSKIFQYVVGGVLVATLAYPAVTLADYYMFGCNGCLTHRKKLFGVIPRNHQSILFV